MRILYLHQYFRTPDSPGGTRSYEMARRLVAAGHEVFMITADDGDDRKLGELRQTDVAGIKVYSVAVPYSHMMNYATRIKSFLQYSWYAARTASKIPADVVFATSTPLTIAIPAVYAARMQRIPMVFEVRDLWPEVPIAMGVIKNPLLKLASRWLERFAYKNSKRVVALAPGMKDGVVATGYPADQVAVIPNGCDVDLFQADMNKAQEIRNSRSWLGERPLVIYAGTLGVCNGVDYLARLAEKVYALDPEIRFLAIGEGREKAKIVELASSLGVLEQNFFLMNPIPKNEIPGWLAATDMVAAVLTGPPVVWKDAVSNKFFDALASGKPIMNNFVGWQSTVSVDEGVGIIVDPEDLDSAARDLVDVMHDRDWREAAGARARRLAQTRFNRDILAGQLETVLCDAVAASESPSRAPAVGVR